MTCLNTLLSTRNRWRGSSDAPTTTAAIRHRRATEFLSFLLGIGASVHEKLDVHLVTDNYGTR